MISLSPSKTGTQSKAVNLMEVTTADAPVTSKIKSEWFTRARFGMFVHYGLYSIMGRGEWAMYFEKIPPATYNILAREFRAERFDAGQLTALAKMAGAGYVVMGARHHEGFCLWDTKTTDFNSVKTASGRDLIREYVDACRQQGLRVGLYHSIMSWQWPAIFNGPVNDPEGWEGMVNETHEQLRELMTHYGKIDYLWYDGCVVPGLGDAGIRAKYWRSRELNEMVRRLQPDILINDRAALPEDVSTPEQHLTPAEGDRLWECCQTMGEYWGWHHQDDEVKHAKDLISQMAFCARYGGNYLLNVGPYGDGSIPHKQAECLYRIGKWMEINGESIRSSERTPYTEAEHMLGFSTCRGKTLYFHLTEWPKKPVLVAGIKTPIQSLRLLGEETSLSCTQTEDGCITLEGLPSEGVLDLPKVVAIELAQIPLRKAPPSLLVEHDTGRHEPAEERVNAVQGWEMGSRECLVFDVPSKGIYHLELGVISEKAQILSYALDDSHISGTMRVDCGNYPATLRLKDLELSPGRHEIELKATQVDFGIYLWRLQPVWKCLAPKVWRTIGPFPTDYKPQGNNDEVRAALQTVFPPEFSPERTGGYTGMGGHRVDWSSNNMSGNSVNLGLLCGGDQVGVCYAAMVLTSPEARDLSLLLSCDWWANLFVNGEMVRSEREPALFAQDGAWFNGWKPIPARVKLVKGDNEFMVKCHPGSTDNWFSFFINDSGDLKYAL